MLGFDLTDEQKELKALARKFAEQEIIPARVNTTNRRPFPGTFAKRPSPRG